MSQKQETFDLLKSFTWEVFKLWFNKRFTPHHLLFKDGMELLELIQRDGASSLACYVQDFIHMLIMVPLKEDFSHKLVFLHGLKPWTFARA
jgi:hypothetical protein